MNISRALALGGSICCFSRGSELWEARFVVFYEGLRLWEAHLHVFYESGRLSGSSGSNDAKAPGGSAKEKTFTGVGGAGGGGGSWDHYEFK